MTREQAQVYAKLSREEVKKINDGYAKHYDVIYAYANGAEIQFKYRNEGDWKTLDSPAFDGDIWTEYRVKPRKEQQTEPWKPEHEGEEYFYVASGGIIIQRSFFDDSFDSNHIAFGNCFQTREEAEAARERVFAAINKETLSKMETVESLDGHELSDAEKGVIRILRRCEFEADFGDFAFANDLREIIVCNCGTLFDFREGGVAKEFCKLANDVSIEAKKRIKKGEPTW